MSVWIEHVESKRTTVLKSNVGVVVLTNITHFKERSHGFTLKCDQGLVYFEKDDISYIICKGCDDWVV